MIQVLSRTAAGYDAAAESRGLYYVLAPATQWGQCHTVTHDRTQWRFCQARWGGRTPSTTRSVTQPPMTTLLGQTTCVS